MLNEPTNTARIVPFPSPEPRPDWQGFTEFASPNLEQAQYQTECLAGLCFPRPGDAEMLRRCRETYRIRHWLALFRRFHTSFYKHQSTVESKFKLYFPPLLDVRPADLTRPVIMQWFHEIGRHSHEMANQSLSLLRTMFTRAEEWQLWEGDNPASRIRWYKKDSRTRFIQPEEMPKLLESLSMEAIPVQTFFLTCLLTGCRGGEARAMKWEHLNLTQGLWSKPTTKNGTPHQVPLPPTLAGMLASFPRTEEWVFGSPRSHGGQIKKSTSFHNWRRIRARAGLDDVTIHDLRRTCASWLAISGENIALISRVLNHTTLATTAIYARLNQAPVKAALSRHENTILRSGYVSLPEAAAPAAPVPLPVMPVNVMPRVSMPPQAIQNVEERDEWPG